MKRHAWLTFFVSCVAAGPTLADTAHPVRHGVMCLSAKALAVLTLPDGDSRTHQPRLRDSDRQIAEEGGCIDLDPAMRLSVYQSFHNTSLVLPTQRSGARGPLYRVPNIDLQISADPVGNASQKAVLPPDVSDVKGAGLSRAEETGAYVVKEVFKVDHGGGTIELLQDRRISPLVFNDLWRAGSGGMLDAREAGLLTGGPLLKAQLRLTFADNLRVRTRDIGFPLATLTPLDDHGEAFSLHVDASDRQVSRIAEERLVPAAHGLTPAGEHAAHVMLEGAGGEASAGPSLADRP